MTTAKKNHAPVSIIIGLALLLLAGCGGANKIEKYEVAKEEPVPQKPADPHASMPHPSGSVAPHAQLGERMLVAMLVSSEKAWFFKVLGGKEQLGAIKNDFFTFVKSVRFEGAESEKGPKWEVPKGWSVQSGSGMRYATLKVDPSDPDLELTVIPLGAQAGNVLSNVNRWREQLKLTPIEEGQIDEVVERFSGDSYQGYAMDLIGPSSAHAEGSHAAPDKSVSDSDSGNQNKNLNYELPEGWKMDPNQKPMRLVSLLVSEGDQRAEVTVIPLPGMAGGLLSNINRWRGQIELPPITEEQLDAQTQKIKVGGDMEGVYAELLGPSEAILVVDADFGGKTWFFKMKGPKDLVQKEKQHFEAFVKSFRFGG